MNYETNLERINRRIAFYADHPQFTVLLEWVFWLEDMLELHEKEAGRS